MKMSSRNGDKMRSARHVGCQNESVRNVKKWYKCYTDDNIGD